MAPILDGGTPTGLPSPSTGLTVTQTILLLAQQLLQDTTGTKWGADILIPYLNLVLLKIINLKPESYPTTQNISLVAGVVQSLPATAIALIDVTNNMGTSGAVRGTEIRTAKKRIMDYTIPGWMSETANTVVKFVVLDEQNPKKFYVYPPQPVSPLQIVEAVLTIPPAELADSDSTFPLDKSYMTASVHELVSVALSEETTIPNALAKAGTFHNLFLQDLGIKSNTETKVAEKAR